MWSWWNLFTVYDSWGIDQSNLTADCITYGVSLLATVALIALYDGAERRMTTRGHQEFLLSSKARVTCIHAILWIIHAYKHANIHIWTQPPAMTAIAMLLHGRGGAPFLMIFEFSLAHLITASKQFISYRSMYTNFTSLSLKYSERRVGVALAATRRRTPRAALQPLRYSRAPGATGWIKLRLVKLVYIERYEMNCLLAVMRCIRLNSKIIRKGAPPRPCSHMAIAVIAGGWVQMCILACL